MLSVDVASCASIEHKKLVVLSAGLFESGSAVRSPSVASMLRPSAPHSTVNTTARLENPYRTATTHVG